MTKEQIKRRINTLETMYDNMTNKASLKDKADLQRKIKALKAQL